MAVARCRHGGKHPVELDFKLRGIVSRRVVSPLDAAARRKHRRHLTPSRAADRTPSIRPVGLKPGAERKRPRSVAFLET